MASKANLNFYSSESNTPPKNLELIISILKPFVVADVKFQNLHSDMHNEQWILFLEFDIIVFIEILPTLFRVILTMDVKTSQSAKNWLDSSKIAECRPKKRYLLVFLETLHLDQVAKKGARLE